MTQSQLGVVKEVVFPNGKQDSKSNNRNGDTSWLSTSGSLWTSAWSGGRSPRSSAQERK